MSDQKIENLLNLSLDATVQERERSESLEVGYDTETQTWEVIVRYSGDLEAVRQQDWQIVVLSGGYAIVTLPQKDVDFLAALSQIEYIEKPKRLYFGLDVGRTASCINPVQSGAFARAEPNIQPETAARGLLGEGVLVAVIDSGVDYFHPDFRKEDGSSRILYLWDQTADAEYTKEEIDRALAAGGREAGLAIVPEQDQSGHGTEVLGIAAGNGRASGGRYRGAAPQSDLIIVKLGIAREQGFPRTTELMQAIEYVYQKAAELGQPMAVNISFGNVYGSHRGNSLLETYMNMMAARGRSVITVGTGNEANTGGHASGRLMRSGSRDRQIGLPENSSVTGGYGSLEFGQQEIELLVSEFEPSLSLQIWKNYVDEFRVSILHPNGRIAGPFGPEVGTFRYQLGSTELLVYYGEPSPYQDGQEIYVDFLPRETYIDSGIWKILLTPQRIVTGEYELWLSDARSRNPGTQFLQPDADVTLTIPSAASQVIAAGAYDARRNAAAAFSGRGWPDDDRPIRPDLVAPGVEITTTAVGGGYVSVTGTSFAAPFVTGSAALMMEWGIVRENDPYLYGEKIRAYLRRGARQLPGFEQWPNHVVGYGALCLRESLPE